MTPAVPREGPAAYWDMSSPSQLVAAYCVCVCVCNQASMDAIKISFTRTLVMSKETDAKFRWCLKYLHFS